MNTVNYVKILGSLIIINILLPAASPGQQIYRTIKGDIAISVPVQDTTLLVASNELIVVLNYETSEINFRVLYSTFKTGIDTIDSLLKSMPLELQYSGKMDIIINRKKHPPQKFSTSGIMKAAQRSQSAEGKGTLVHLTTGTDTNPSCRLTLTMHYTLSGLNLTDVFSNAPDDVQIDILQSLLEKEKN